VYVGLEVAMELQDYPRTKTQKNCNIESEPCVRTIEWKNSKKVTKYNLRAPAMATPVFPRKIT